MKQLIIVRTDLDMGKGKLAAQCCHASVSAFLKTQEKDEKAVEEWLNQGQPKIVLKVKNEKELLEWFEKLRKRFPCALITDAGKTQITPGTKTCFGIGPVEDEEIDKYTNELKLL